MNKMRILSAIGAVSFIVCPQIIQASEPTTAAETPGVVTGMRWILIAGAALVVLMIALAVANGFRSPSQYKKDWQYGKHKKEQKERERAILSGENPEERYDAHDPSLKD